MTALFRGFYLRLVATLKFISHLFIDQYKFLDQVFMVELSPRQRQNPPHACIRSRNGCSMSHAERHEFPSAESVRYLFAFMMK